MVAVAEVKATATEVAAAAIEVPVSGPTLKAIDHGMTTPDPSGPLLEVCDLSIRFGDTGVLDKLNLTLRPGQIHALVGESGSGKSLACLALADLQPANAQVEGTVAFLGQSVERSDPQALRTLRSSRIRYVFQDPYGTFNPSIRIGPQIEESFPGTTPARARRARSGELLRSVGLDTDDRVRRSWPFQMSGGMLQRAAIAMALAGQPKVLVCDEPTTALDPLLRRDIVDVLASLAREQGIGILFVTHDLRLLKGFADTVTVLEHGITRDQGNLDGIFNGDVSGYTRELIEALPRLPNHV